MVGMYDCDIHPNFYVNLTDKTSAITNHIQVLFGSIHTARNSICLLFHVRRHGCKTIAIFLPDNGEVSSWFLLPNQPNIS